MKIPVKGTNFVKDTTSGALLTVNPGVLMENEARLRLKSKLNSKNDEINNLITQVDSLNKDSSEIKSMLQQLIKRD